MGFFEGLACKCRVFVTNPNGWSVSEVVEFYNKRAAVENLIKESNNDAGLTAHPSGIWAMNVNHFQFSMLAYNLNCWLALFQREETATVADLTHRTMATTRLRVLYLATRRADGDYMRKPLPGAGIVRFADGKLWRIECKAHECGPVVAIPLRA